jgi:hypothetical protein
MSETKSFKESEFVDNTIGGQSAYMFFILDPKRIYKTDALQKMALIVNF